MIPDRDEDGENRLPVDAGDVFDAGREGGQPPGSISGVRPGQHFNRAR